jgi:hypothetical protein
VGWGDQVDIVRPLFLKADHKSGQFVIVHRLPLHLPAELVILTEEAFEVAAGKKNRS